MIGEKKREDILGEVTSVTLIGGTAGSYVAQLMQTIQHKDTRGYQHSGGCSRNLSLNDLKQREIELEEGSARVSWYETQLPIGQPNGGSPKFQGVSPNFFSSRIIC